MQATLFSFCGQEPPCPRKTSAPFFVYSKNIPKIVPKIQQVDYKTRDRHSNAYPYPTNVRPFAELGLIPLCPGPPRSGGVLISRRTARRTGRPNVFVQLASSSDADRGARLQYDKRQLYHGHSWGTCLPYVHRDPLPSFALRVGNDLQ